MGGGKDIPVNCIKFQLKKKKYCQGSKAQKQIVQEGYGVSIFEGV